MAEIRNVVCDMCGGAPAKTYALAERPNVPWMVDLCESCSAPIRAWREHGRQGPNRRAYRRFSKVPSEAR
jgi:hypothetical protein